MKRLIAKADGIDKSRQVETTEINNYFNVNWKLWSQLTSPYLWREKPGKNYNKSVGFKTAEIQWGVGPNWLSGCTLMNFNHNWKATTIHANGRGGGGRISLNDVIQHKSYSLELQYIMTKSDQAF